MEDLRAGKGRITMAKAKAAVARMSRKQLEALGKEDKEYDFDGGEIVHRGAIMGRPKKEIKREVAAVRIPSDALAKIKALGRGWSTRAGDALAKLVNKGLL
jgi:uncharacterized protein (DUF4415 family)